MFQFASPALTRKFILAGGLGATLLCATLGGLALYLTRCDMRDYLNRAAPVPGNRPEQYLFACGNVWHSRDGGRVWVRMSARGLPFEARDGHLAADRQPGILYLGLLINSQSSVYCLNCAWTKLRPAIYVSTDNGRTWTFSYKFKRGPAEDGGFLGLFADPERAGVVYAVIKNSDEIAYYGTGTSGRFWKQLCAEYYFTGSGGCELPDSVLHFLNRPLSGETLGQ
jgi:hypothetical protein